MRENTMGMRLHWSINKLLGTILLVCRDNPSTNKTSFLPNYCFNVEHGVQLFQIVYANNHVEAQVVGWSFIMHQVDQIKGERYKKGDCAKITWANSFFIFKDENNAINHSFGKWLSH